MTFPDMRYVSFESPIQREFALSDPVAFLRSVADGAILDEIQRVPDLTSYLQVMVDEDPAPGRFVLTGSRNFAVMEAVSQSLAGRTGLLELMPLSLSEIRLFSDSPEDKFEILLKGGYPRIYHRRPDHLDWLGSYIATYVERDVRQILQVGNLHTFQNFLKLCAGRVGQLTNLVNIGDAAGITHKTVQSWLSVLEAGYIIFRLRPWFGNIKKRLIKTPKLYFTDTGLLCYLLGIFKGEQLLSHPLRGAIFENWVVAELQRREFNIGRRPEHFFYRDRKGLEVDLIAGGESSCFAIEIKSGETITREFFKNLERFASIQGTPDCKPVVVYGGNMTQARSSVLIVPWNSIDLEGES